MSDRFLDLPKTRTLFNIHAGHVADEPTWYEALGSANELLARIAALEAEVERLKSFEIYEVFTAADGEPATRPVNWPEKVAELEAFKRDVCRRASQDQHGWSAWVAGWQRREDS